MTERDESETSATRADSEGRRETAANRSEAATSVDATGEDAEPAIATAEDQLDAARKEAAENYERFVRAKADLDNIRKRHQRELEDRARYDGESLARDILQAIDDLERALGHAGSAGPAVTGGIELVLKGLLSALKRNGVERIEAQGKPFDPAEHEAVTMVATDEAPPGTVVAVFRAGYRIRDRLLRAAMVSVARAPQDDPAMDQES
ncbi:MAG TPA: nucleotide exchange factor GrpE [Candidatus Binatia bacterium]|jgi:molecular chaperone GrpE